MPWTGCQILQSILGDTVAPGESHEAEESKRPRLENKRTPAISSQLPNNTETNVAKQKVAPTSQAFRISRPAGEVASSAWQL